MSGAQADEPGGLVFIDEWRDQRVLGRATVVAKCVDQFVYRHARPSAEPLLILSDVIAWAWARGGDWRRRCDPLSIRVVDA